MKNVRSYLPVLLAPVMACSVFAALALAPATTVSAAAKPVNLSATRYRYPIGRFENPKFTKGVSIDKCQATSAYLLTDAAKQNGKPIMTEGGDLTWLWIVIGAVVVIGAGLAVFFILKGKKKGEEPEAEAESEEKTEK